MHSRTLRFPLLAAVILIALSGAAGSALGGLGAKDEESLLPVESLEGAGVRVRSSEAVPAETAEPVEPDAVVPETRAPAPKPQPKPPAPKPQPKPPAPKPKPDKPAPRPDRPKPAPRDDRARERAEARRREARAEERQRKREERKAAEEARKLEEQAAEAALLPTPNSVSKVPNFVIERFRIPIFLLPIYQAAGIEYGVRWEVLAAINEIETDYGRNLNISSAGARGWMQFMPATWKMYGTDANRDGKRDPYNPVDAIFAAARYLKAAGYASDPRRAVFAYNHADWYVNDVFERAKLIAEMPLALVGALSGLADGRFPVRGKAAYEGALDRRSATSRIRRGESPAHVVSDSEDRDYMDIRGRRRAPVVSVSDGVVRRVFRTKRGRKRGLVIEDSYGNRYGYWGIARMSEGFEVAGRKRGKKKFVRLRRGAHVPGGTVLGRLGRKTPVLRFSIRPAGDDAPVIDPKPILDGWRLLEKTNVYRPSGKSALKPNRKRFSVGQALLLPKSLLARRVLADNRISIYPCGRADIETGRIDRRVLALLSYLAELGLHPTVTSLQCGHGYYTASGNVSHHSTGTAVDIAAINGVSILGHQEAGGVTDQAVRAIMRLQGTMAPAQVISLLDYGAPTVAMGDHHDHIHVGYRPGEGTPGHGGSHVHGAATAVLESSQWDDVVEQVAKIDNPEIKSPIEWHRPANLSCKYKRAMDAQGGRGEAKPLKSIAELAEPKQLRKIEALSPRRPCFGFGTPGTL